MDEAAWLECIDPIAILKPFRRTLSERRLWLACLAFLDAGAAVQFGCGATLGPPSLEVEGAATVCRGNPWYVLRKCVDGEASWDDFYSAVQGTHCSEHEVRGETTWDVVLRQAESVARRASRHALTQIWSTEWNKHAGKSRAALEAEEVNATAAILAAEQLAISRVLRDLLGNPFHPSTISAPWLTWNDSMIPKLARGIDRESHFNDMPILADALEDAGCADEAMLSHCRDPGSHVRGCWVIDLILGKK